MSPIIGLADGLAHYIEFLKWCLMRALVARSDALVNRLRGQINDAQLQQDACRCDYAAWASLCMAIARREKDFRAAKTAAKEKSLLATIAALKVDRDRIRRRYC